VYNIRLAEEEDFDVVLKMGTKFLTTMEISKMIPVDEDSASAQVFNLLDNGFILLAEKDSEAVGMMGCLFVDYPYNRAFKLCREVFLWMEPEERGGHVVARMIKEAEALAIHEGASCVIMAALETSPEGIESFYNKLGYRRAERAYVKGV